MKTFSISWNSYGYMDIEAESEEEAEEKFYALSEEEKKASSEEEYQFQFIEEVKD